MNEIHTLLVSREQDSEELSELLTDAGLEVTAVDSATTAVAMLSKEEFDCLVSTYALPGDDGLALFEAVRSIDEQTPFVLYADVGEAVASEAFTAGVDRFVSRTGERAATRLIEEITDLTSPVAALPRQQDISDHSLQPTDIVRAIDEAPVGVSICDPSLPDYPLVYVNDAWEDITGYAREEVLGRNPRILQGPETDPETVRALAAAFENEQSVSVELRNYRRDGTPFWNELTVAPIHDRNGDLSLYVGFQDDVTSRKSAEQLAQERAANLTEEKQALRRILSRVNGLVNELTRILVEEQRRPLIVQQVCDEIVNTDGYVASWFGSVSPPGDELELEARAGVSWDSPSSISIESVPDVVQAAIDSGELQLCSVEDPEAEFLTPASMDARRLVVVPIVYGEKVYGVLGVYGEGVKALDRREQQLFASIGTMIATRLNAIETTQILATDTVVEVKIAVKDETFPLAAVASALDSEVEYIGMTSDNGTDELFLNVSGSADVAEVSTLPVVESVRNISRTDSAYTFAVTVESASPFTDLADYGAAVTSASAEPGRATLVVELPPEYDVRSILAVLEDRYDHVELRSRREEKARSRTDHELASGVEQRLTERQRTAIEAAHMNGYFEWPRPTDGTAIAETMGITRQTFHQHLREAQRKLVDAYIEQSSSDTRDRETLSQKA